MRRLALSLGLSALIAFGVPHPGSAQRFFDFDDREALAGEGLADPNSGFTFCRLRYRSVRSDNSGGGWTVDYPRGERNLLWRLSQLTPTKTPRTADGEPKFTVVRATDLELYQCPFLMASDVGEMGLDDDEVVALRDYLLKGGFLWADDYWGEEARADFASQIQRVLPEFAIVELPLTHPLFDIVYEIPEVPQIPNLGFWERSGGGTSEMGQWSEIPTLRAILDETGRMMVVMTHNTDIADGWEREGDSVGYFESFSPDAYAVGVNIAVWMMTH